MLYFAPPRPSPSSSPLPSSTKEGEVLGLTPSNWGHRAAEVPSAYSSSCPAFISAAPMWSRSGVGTIWFSGTKTSLTTRLVLHCPGEGFFWPSLSLDWTSTRNEDSDDFGDLRPQKLARVSFVDGRLIHRMKAGSATWQLPPPESVPSN